jgi:hypothetical protein
VGGVVVGGCVPCDQIGRVCVNGACLPACESDDDCGACRRCADGICVNDCPPQQICDWFGQCRASCTSVDDCAACEFCAPAGLESNHCLECESAATCLACNEAGECVAECSTAQCQECDGLSGSCFQRCVGAEVCDGAGNCVEKP